MPEYLAPGVYVEETSFRQKTIEGVSTSTTGFVGPTRFGPTDGEPPLLTSFAEFERIYGGIDRLSFNDTSDPSHNYVAHAVRAYFEEGGRRLYVARTWNASTGGDGIASWDLETSPPSSPPEAITLSARYPGAAGNMRVTFLFRTGENVLGSAPVDASDPAGDTYPVLRGVSNYSVVLARSAASPPGEGTLYWVERFFDETAQRQTWRLWEASEDPGSAAADATQLDAVSEVRVVTVSVLVDPMGQFEDAKVWENLTFDARHRDGLPTVFASENPSRATRLYVPLVLETELGNGAAIAAALAGQGNLADGTAVIQSLRDTGSSDTARSFRVLLSGGDDGDLPGLAEYQGDDGSGDGRKSGLESLADLEDISIVAAPGSTFDYAGDTAVAEAVTRQLIAHCERMRYRIAVLDSVDGQTLGEARSWRSSLDSTRAAFYYPWVEIFDPVTEDEIYLPPSGFLTGIYARNDIERGVHKAPANEVVRLATGLEFLLNKAQQDVLNPDGINCLRFFEGRGFRVWGARTTTSDPEWKYVNVRRYLAFLERSIEKGTQWAVFENNGEVLWANLRRTVEDFLFNEWSSNHLMGSTPEEAFFVRCDRSTMTQNDIDNGRLICLIGVAPLRPAEFVIFRIGQKTADARS